MRVDCLLTASLMLVVRFFVAVEADVLCPSSTGVALMATETRTVVPLNLFFVEYDEQDPVGMFFAFLSLSPFFLVVSVLTLIVFKREFFTIFFFVGQLMNELGNNVAKVVIAQPRPFGMTWWRKTFVCC